MKYKLLAIFVTLFINTICGSSCRAEGLGISSPLPSEEAAGTSTAQDKAVGHLLTLQTQKQQLTDQLAVLQVKLERARDSVTTLAAKVGVAKERLAQTGQAFSPNQKELSHGNAPQEHESGEDKEIFVNEGSRSKPASTLSGAHANASEELESALAALGEANAAVKRIGAEIEILTKHKAVIEAAEAKAKKDLDRASGAIEEPLERKKAS